MRDAEWSDLVVHRGPHARECGRDLHIPVVDAADFLAMLRGDGVAATPSSSGRAPKRRRKKK